MQPTTSTTAAQVLPPITRRHRAAAAFDLAYARRDGDMRALGPWLLGYLESLQTSPMTDRQIADTVRGIVDAYQRQRAAITAELDAAFAAALGERPGTTS